MGAITAYGTVVVVLVDLRWTLPAQRDCDKLDRCMTTSRKILFNKFVRRSENKSRPLIPQRLYTQIRYDMLILLLEKKTRSTAIWYESMKFLCTYRGH